MADDVQDIAIYTGSEWTSLSELAAGVVDAKLPIESVDGTVKLDGASSVFTVSTGGEERVKVSEPETIIASRYVKQSPTAGKFSAYHWTAVDDTVLSTITQYNSDYNSASTLDVGPLSLAVESPKNIGLKFAADGQLVVGSDVPRFTVDVNQCVISVPTQIPSVRGPAENDAEVTLGASAKIQTEVNNSFQINPAGHSYGVLHTARNNSRSAHVTRPFLESINDAANYNVRQTAWEYTAIDLVSGDPSNPYLLNDYFSQAFPGKVDSYKGFSVGGFDPALMEATEAVGCYLNVGLPNDGRDWYSIWCNGIAPSRFDGDILCSRISGIADGDASITLGVQATLKAGDGSEYVPTDSASIATKKIVDDKIWVGTTASYNAIATKNPTTLYCLTD